MLKHSGTQTLSTERLTLRAFCETDAEPMFRNWAADPVVTRFLTWDVHPNLEASKEILEIWKHQYEKPQTYNWAIIDDVSEEAIGGISVVGIDQDHESCEIGYCISTKFWNLGIMTEAFSAIMAYLFEDVGFNRIIARHDPENPASGRVMQKCGMQLEGISREVKKRSDGTFYDLATYAILKKEYLKQNEETRCQV